MLTIGYGTEIATGALGGAATVRSRPLRTANAFFVPNALLGAAFYAGCILWWLVGKRLGTDFHFHLARTLTFWLIVASVATLWFFWLLARLPAYCPLCPLNHLFTYLALASALVLRKQIPPPSHPIRWKPILALVVTCVLLFVLLQLAWYAAVRSGLLG
ncbi:MAG: hypothetical protein ACR2L2_14255 [Acidobacteriota bacterium]